MRIPQRLIVMAMLGLTVAVLSFSTKRDIPPKFKNLKVLSKNISEEELDKVMDEFKVSLGVMCFHCHVKSKENPKEWDFASDEKPEKDKARGMLKMTEKLNRKFFRQTQSVSCYTCHNGKTKPQKQP